MPCVAGNPDRRSPVLSGIDSIKYNPAGAA